MSTQQLHLPAPRNGYTEAEDQVVDLFRRAMAAAKQLKACGRLTLEVDLNDGGIVAKWLGTRYREK